MALLPYYIYMVPFPILPKQKFLEEDIFSLLGLKMISDEKKDVLLEKFSEVVNARVFVRILDSFSEVERQELETVAPDELMLRILENSTDVVGIIAEESVRYRAQLVQTMTSASTFYVNVDMGVKGAYGR